MKPDKIADEDKAKERSTGPAPTFPRYTLTKALGMAESIEKNNAGKPYDRLDLAKSLNWSPNSSGFRLLIVAAGRYGLTEGGYQADKIALTPLGSSIVAPTSDTEKATALRKALLSPDLFNKVYNFFDKKAIPREELFKNTLKKEFGVAADDVDVCYSIVMQNMKEQNLIQEIKGNLYLQLNKLGSSTITEEPATEGLEQQPEMQQPAEESIPKPTKEEEKPVIKQIFIAHGKNRKPLEQLQKILDQFKVKYKVAIDEPHKGRPISGKVAELMKSCTSAIFIFTGDEETHDAEGNVKYRPSDNVVYELGAASVLYDNKIVIFKEENVDFASDFRDFGYISFEKDKLDAKTMDLMKELIGFGILQITPA